MEAFKHVSVVLDSGGFRGSFHIGAVERLLELGIKIDAISGTSIGAINAAGIASNRFRELSAIWSLQTEKGNLLSERNTFGLLGVAIQYWLHRDMAKCSFISNKKVKEAISVISADDLINSDIKSVFTYTALNAKKYRSIYSIEKNRNLLKDAILASAAIPGIFPMIRLSNGDTGVDGGLVEAVPMREIIPLAKQANSEKIIVILCGSQPATNTLAIKNIRDFLLAVYTTYSESLQKMNIELGKAKYNWKKRKDVIVIEANDLNLLYSPLECNHQKIMALKKHGYDRATEIFNKIEENYLKGIEDSTTEEIEEEI